MSADSHRYFLSIIESLFISDEVRVPVGKRRTGVCNFKTTSIVEKIEFKLGTDDIVIDNLIIFKILLLTIILTG